MFERNYKGKMIFEITQHSFPLEIDINDDTKYPKITDYLNLKSFQDQQFIANAIYEEIHSIAGYIFEMWNQFINIIRSNPKMIISKLQLEYKDKIVERLGSSVLRNFIPTNDFTFNETHDSGTEHERISQAIRNQLQFQIFDGIQIQDIKQFPIPAMQPIIFEDIYYRPQQQTKQEIQSRVQDEIKGIHLIVCVHGFQGHSFDMRAIKNYLTIVEPNLLCLSSTSNEDRTDNDIFELGKNLAEEVTRFIQNQIQENQLTKISFIGHSLGGLIIRASIEHLQNYRNKFHTYISLSSPHLGYMYNSSEIISAVDALKK